jgi:hypothetical protein
MDLAADGFLYAGVQTGPSTNVTRFDTAATGSVPSDPAFTVTTDSFRIPGVELAPDGRRLAFLDGGSASQGSDVSGAVRSGGSFVNLCSGGPSFCPDEELREYLRVSIDEPDPAAPAVADASSAGTVDVAVESNAFTGYALSATDTSDLAGLSCSTGACAGSSVPDWWGSDSTPSTWAESGSNYGFGITVLGTGFGTRLAKWGSGSGATDYAANRYAGLRSSSSVLLHRTDRFFDDAPDVTTIAWRARVSPTQRSGEYATTVTFTAMANP